jgi:hypothetical protein
MNIYFAKFQSLVHYGLIFEGGECKSTKVLQIKQTPWSESASELYWPSNHRLSGKLVPAFVDRGYHVVSMTDPYGRIFKFLDRSSYFFFQVASNCTHGAEW